MRLCFESLENRQLFATLVQPPALVPPAPPIPLPYANTAKVALDSTELSLIDPKVDQLAADQEQAAESQLFTFHLDLLVENERDG